MRSDAITFTFEQFVRPHSRLLACVLKTFVSGVDQTSQ